MKTLLYILANGIYAFLTLSIFLGYFALKHYSYTISDNGEDINLLNAYGKPRCKFCELDPNRCYS